MKKIITLGIMLLFLGMTISSSTGFNLEKQTTIATLDGNTLYVGGSGANNYSKIQDAIDNASDGDTVFVYDDSSPYIENLIVDESINLIGEDKNTTIVDGSESGSVVSITADNILIREFCIRNSSEDLYPKYYAGIDIRSNYNTISGNIITNNQDGIVFYNYTSDSKIIDNTILKSIGWGVHLARYNHNIIISGNTIADNSGGIYVWKSDYNNISYNIIMGNIGHGIYMYDSCDNVIFANDIIKNGLSIFVGDWSGISLRSSHINLIYGNNIANNREGISILDAGYNNVFLNNIEKNLIGILLYTGSEGNVFSNNNFIKNVLHVASNVCNNKWNLNYWNRPRILPKPIMGMKIFIINYPIGIPLPWLMFDWHPAQEPYDIGV